MKKTIIFLSLFLPSQYTYGFWPFDAMGDSIGIKTAEKLNEAVDKAKPIAWTGVGVAGAYVVYRICDGIAYQFGDEAAVKKLENKQKRELIAAKKTLLDSLKKNVAGAMGSFGLPKACDPAVQALVLLPGGKEELEKIIDLFKQYVSPK
jgi:hypothetical protein